MEKQKSNSPYHGCGGITREQFLFPETRITARLLLEGKSDEEVVECILSDNLFQYPTERMIKNLAKVCIRRVRCLEDDSLIRVLANDSFEPAKQVCLYGMMKDNRLIWDFMMTVIGEKYTSQNLSFSRSDVNEFFLRLQEQDDLVASWSESTIKKIISVIMSVLVQNGYLDSFRATAINPVWLYGALENAIRSNGDMAALAAFNCFQ